MHRTKAQSQQNMQRSKNRIARYKSLETSGMTTLKSRSSVKKQNGFASKCGSSVVKESSELMNGSQLNVSSSSSTESSEKPESESSPIGVDEFSSYAGFREIVPKRYLASGTEFPSTDEERNIVAMPVELERERDSDITDIKQLVYGRDYIPMCITEKSLKTQTTSYNRNDTHPTREKNLEKGKEKVEGQKILKRPIIPDGSYIISKENYIISKQARIPQEIIEEGRLRADRLNSAIGAGSASEVVDNTKLIRFVSTVCLVAFVLVLTCVGWYWFFLKLPTSEPKKMSLLRYYIEKSYEALLEIYE